ncbi:MAG: hypothetical protein AAGA73_11160 [Pseudomonadota bacterium]
MTNFIAFSSKAFGIPDHDFIDGAAWIIRRSVQDLEMLGFATEDTAAVLRPILPIDAVSLIDQHPDADEFQSGG